MSGSLIRNTLKIVTYKHFVFKHWLFLLSPFLLTLPVYCTVAPNLYCVVWYYQSLWQIYNVCMLSLLTSGLQTLTLSYLRSGSWQILFIQVVSSSQRLSWNSVWNSTFYFTTANLQREITQRMFECEMGRAMCLATHGHPMSPIPDTEEFTAELCTL